MRPILLDLFCGAGGASRGYDRAGFDVVGIDIEPQPHYPYPMLVGDALLALDVIAARSHGRLELDGRPIAAAHASPPCQRWSTMTTRHGAGRTELHPDLVAPVRNALGAFGVPFVIENVPRAPLVNATTLCGSMFGLGAEGRGLRRHRLFEPHGFELWPPASCAHTGQALAVYGHAGGRSTRDGISFPGVAAWREGMGIDWMTGDELAEAIPPAYTEWVGAQMIAALKKVA